MNNVGIIGVGKLGLCFALLLEKAGYNVIASDTNGEYIRNLTKKHIETPEPHVLDLLKQSKNIEFVTNNEKVIESCAIIYIFVATPSLSDGSYDISSIRKIIKQIKDRKSSSVCTGIVIGCTVNPGDCNDFQNSLQDMNVYYNPEFIAQGSIIDDLKQADLVLIGGNGHHIPYIKKIYKNIQITEPKIYVLSTLASELVKIAVNCFLTTKISFANMIGDVLKKYNIGDETDEVLSAIGADSRIGNKYLKYGFGFGGPCLPRDNRSLAHAINKVGFQHNIGKVVDDLNNEHHKFLLHINIKNNKDNLPYVFEYITYKKGTSILAESQQYRLAIELLDNGYEVWVIDDNVRNDCDSRLKWGVPPGNYMQIKL